MAENINIAGRLHSTATGNVVAGANEIYDDTKGKKQSVVNQETDAALDDRYTKSQTYNKTELNNMITTPNQQYVTVSATDQTTAATDVLPATGSADTVYRVGNWDGSRFDASCYTEYSWNGSAYVHISTKTQIGEVFDISAYKASGGTLATFADLAAALDSGNNIPITIRRGGMSIKFVQSSDNKYVQYRYMGTSTADADFANVNNWQGVDEIPTYNSSNLPSSKGTAELIAEEVIIGKKRLSLTGTYGSTTKNGYSLGSDGTISQNTGSSASKYRVMVINNAVNKGAVLRFTGTSDRSARFTVGISSVPITDDNITSVQLTILQSKSFTGDMNVKLIVPFDGYIAYYRYTDYWTNVIPSIYNSNLLQDNSVLDVSELNGGTSYANLTAALGGVPTTLKKGGMEIRFRQLTPATYTVVKTEGVETQPTGTEVQEALSLNSGTYTAAQMTGVTPPESGSVTYYLAVIETVDEQEVTTYTTWIITKATSDVQNYVQYRLMAADWSDNTSDWQGTIDKVKAGSRNLVESGCVSDAVYSLKAADESIINTSNMFKYEIVEQTESLSGYSISASTGAIVASTASNASVDYIPVSAGDIIRIEITERIYTNRLAYGLYSTVEANAPAIDYMNFAGPIETGSVKLFICNASGYFAIYTLNRFSLYKVTSKVLEDDYVMNVEAGRFNVHDGMINPATGNTTQSETRQYTDYIDISSFNELVYTRCVNAGSAAAGLCFYSGKNVNSFISGIKEIQNASVTGYTIEKAVIPEGAVYARFTFWKNKSRGNFFFGDPTRDPVIAKLMKVSDRQSFVNGSVISFDGKNNTYAYSDVLYVDENQKVLKFIVRDPDYSRNNVTSGKAFIIYAYNASDNLMRLAYVDYSETIDKEYICVIPEGTSYIRIGGKCDEGYSCVCDIIDISNEYLHTNVYNDANDFITYKTSSTGNINRALLNFDVKNDLILYVGLKNPESVYQYSVTGYNINSEHSSTGRNLINYDNTVAFCKEIKVTDFKYIGIFVKDGSDDTNVVSVEDIVNDLEIKVMSRDNFKCTVDENTKDVMLCGLRVESAVLKTDFNVKLKENIKMRVCLPEWLKVRFYKGLRQGRSYTPYYYNGDMVELDYTAGFTQVNVSRLDERSYTQQSIEYFQKLINDGKIRFEVQDVFDATVIDRNFDAEKYLGAITSTPSKVETLPMIVHTSDTHGDAERLKNVHDWADYIGADLIVNTGDNPFYLMGDGINFVKEIVFAHKTDFANCLGNHDTYDTSGGVAGYTQKNIGVFAETYHYYKEVVNGEPVVTDTAYYYKDLEEQKLRIIAVNEYDNIVTSNYKARVSQTQIDWFIATLASTPEDYGVIILMHQVPHTLKAIVGKTNFNDTTMNKGNVAEDEWQCSGIDSDYMTTAPLTGNPFGKIVDAFISKTTVSGTYNQKNAAITQNETISYNADFTNVAEGVEFIMYLNGHTHRDFVGYVSDCTHRQLNIDVCSTNPFSQSSGFKSPADIYRDDRANQDAFNVYTINRTDKTVGIARIGSNLSKDLRDRKVMFVSYADS